MANINEFISTIAQAGGVARPNRFAVQIASPNIAAILAVNPQALGQQNGVNLLAQNQNQNIQQLGFIPDYFAALGISPNSMPDRLDFMCCKAELPGKEFNTSEIKTYGATFQMPHVDAYSEIPLTFIVGHDMAERQFFDAWSYLVQDPETSDFNYVSEYGTTMDIFQMDEFDAVYYGVRFFQCWPRIIGEMKLEYGEFDTYHTLEVTFTYRKWVNLLINTGIPQSVQANGPVQAFDSTINPK